MSFARQPYAEEDLAQGLLRVLHERSFIDDPTRLWRLGRYAARLQLPARGAYGGAGAARRSRRERPLRSRARATAPSCAWRSPRRTPRRAIAELRSLGVLGAVGIDGDIEESTLREALALLPADGRGDLLLLAALLAGSESGGEIGALLDHLAFAAGDRDRVVAAVLALPGLLRELPASSQPSRLYALAASAPIEAVALAAALADAGEDGNAARANAERWLRELRHVRVQINGDDLIEAGVPQGPEIGRRLRAVLERRLDGELAEGREAELRAALEGG